VRSLTREYIFFLSIVLLAGFDFIGAMASIVFAYQGQSIFFELIGEMKHGQQFPRATLVAYLVMFLSYATTIVIAYGSNGADTPGFLPDILKSGSASAIAVSVLTLFHLIVAYVIAVQPLHVWFHKTFFSKTLYHSTWSGTRDWLIISFTFTLFGWTVANLIPFFADIQALIGTLFGAPIMFGWPPLFYFLTKRRNTESKTIKETVASMGMFYTIVSGFMMFVLVPVFVIVGTWGSVKQIIEDAEDAGLPFQC
jgi:Transmembrane amino acid transporter protein